MLIFSAHCIYVCAKRINYKEIIPDDTKMYLFVYSIDVISTIVKLTGNIVIFYP